jgi:DNA-binding MarR family transcriptional regulator
MVVNSGLPELPDLADLRGLGPDLRRAWVGYRVLLLAEMQAAGFGDTVFPDGRVLRICLRHGEVTIAEIGRRLGISRQGAGKAVSSLRERGYISVADSPVSGREKAVTLTDRGRAYLETQRQAARRIEWRLQASVGTEGFVALRRLLSALAEEGRGSEAGRDPP